MITILQFQMKYNSIFKCQFVFLFGLQPPTRFMYTNVIISRYTDYIQGCSLEVLKLNIS